MENIDKIELLYQRIFELAYNYNFIAEDNLIKARNALSLAVDIYNLYEIDGTWVDEDYDYGRLIELKRHIESNIQYIKANKNYECNFNSNHKIEIGEKYGSIHYSQNLRERFIICEGCLAKIMIIIITKFPPTNRYLKYKIKSEIDF